MSREFFRPALRVLVALFLMGAAATAPAEEIEQTVMAMVNVSENGELLEHRVYPGASYLIKPTFDRFVRYYNYPPPRDSQGNIVASKGHLQANYRFVSNEDGTFNVYLDDQKLRYDYDVGQYEPKLIKRKNPYYPQNAVAGRVEGWVIAEFTITKKGKVRNIEIAGEFPTGAFGSAVKSALKRWRFQPVVVDGSPVEIKEIQVFEFFLQDDPE